MTPPSLHTLHSIYKLIKYLSDVYKILIILFFYFSLAVSVKMNILLFAPALLLAYLATQGKFFIMSMEFDKNISDWGYDSTDHKNVIDFSWDLLNGQK